jgi:hypothetical protein
MPGKPRFRLSVETTVGVVRLLGRWCRKWPASPAATPRRGGRCEKTWWRVCLELVAEEGDGTTYDAP